MTEQSMATIKAIIGLGNPGRQYKYNRHSIGFQVVDELAKRCGGSWSKKENMELAEITLNGQRILLIKPLTFMNSSGQVVPFLLKKGIKADNILVVHDELELPFGKIQIKKGGSAKGHNGLKSIIQACGDEFYRLRFGIGRPAEREQVPDYVLEDFTENPAELTAAIEKSVALLEATIR